MQTSGPRRLLALSDLSWPEMDRILARAGTLARLWSERMMPRSLEGRNVAMVVNDDGWRNTTAFDLGIQAMGGRCIHAPLRLDRREAVGDLTAYLGNWFDAAVVRAPDLATLRAFAEAAPMPVVNARTKRNHPCETLGDLAWWRARHGGVEGLKVAVVSPDANILGSWIEAARVAPLEVVQVYPERWLADRLAGRGFRTSSNMGELRDANIIVTDCWPEGAEEEDLERNPISLDRSRTG